MGTTFRRITSAVTLGVAAVGMSLLGTGTASAAGIPRPPDTSLEITTVNGTQVGEITIHGREILTATSGVDGGVHLTAVNAPTLPADTVRLADVTAQSLDVTVTQHRPGLPPRTVDHLVLGSGEASTFCL